MKKIIKIAVMLAIIICIQIPNSIVYAEDPNEMSGYSSKDLHNIIDTNEYSPEYEEDTQGELKIKVIAGTIVNVIRNIGIVVAVIALMVIGIRTMVASVEEKAVYKQALPGYVLGIVMVIAITAIPSAIYSLVQSWNN